MKPVLYTWYFVCVMASKMNTVFPKQWITHPRKKGTNKRANETTITLTQPDKSGLSRDGNKPNSEDSNVYYTFKEVTKLPLDNQQNNTWRIFKRTRFVTVFLRALFVTVKSHEFSTKNHFRRICMRRTWKMVEHLTLTVLSKHAFTICGRMQVNIKNRNPGETLT